MLYYNLVYKNQTFNIITILLKDDQCFFFWFKNGKVSSRFKANPLPPLHRDTKYFWRKKSHNMYLCPKPIKRYRPKLLNFMIF